jgi:hypothetical protein
MTTKTLRVTYWSITGLFCALQAWSAVQYFIEAPRMMATIRELGYPVYFVKLLGVAKVLGIAAILYGGFPRLKEWAYAGLTFDTLGAACSHLAVGDPLLIAAVPLAFCAAQLASYFLWKRLEAASTSPARGLHPRRPRVA